MSYSPQASDKTNGRWTKEQHENFILGLQMYGKNWKKIQELIGTRNGSQIRSHAQKFFLKFKKTYSTESNSDPTEQIQKENQTLNSKCSTENGSKFTDYSYFVGKIVQFSSSQGPFDFWETLIDHQSRSNQEVEENQSSRKNSFSECSEEDQDIEKLSSLQKKIKI